jgi:hypothetical protein
MRAMPRRATARSFFAVVEGEAQLVCGHFQAVRCYFFEPVAALIANLNATAVRVKSPEGTISPTGSLSS